MLESADMARLVVITMWLAATLIAPAAWSQTITNPIAPLTGDPWVIEWQGQYFYTHTTGGNVRVYRATRLQDVASNQRTVWRPPPGTAYSEQVWAPELHRLNGKWYIYVAASDGDNATHRMYVLEGNSQDPQGTYTFRGQIGDATNRWAIDGTVFEHGGQRYFVWSGWEGDENVRQELFIARMANPWTIVGPRRRISTPTHDWEKHGLPINEGPQVLTHDDDVFVTFSASGFWTPNYAVGTLKLTGVDPTEPASWTKHPAPLFDAGNGVQGTGHASFVKSPDGTEDWIVYHAHRPDNDPGGPVRRDLRIQPFTFGPDGLPDFGEPVATGQPIPAPAGEHVVTFIPNGAFDRPDVTVNQGAGRGVGLESFGTFGAADAVGVVSNDGRFFDRLARGDGPQAAWVNAVNNNGFYQDIGALHSGRYRLIAGLALRSDELEAAAANPATVRLRLESIGLNNDGTVNNLDRVLLSSFDVDSRALNGEAFSDFGVAASLGTQSDRLGTMLRLVVEVRDASQDGPGWDVLIDNLRLRRHLPGDADADGDVDAFDLGVWQSHFGMMGSALAADFDSDGDVDGFDLGLWQSNFGTGPNGTVEAPEPAGAAVYCLLGAGLLNRRR